MSSRSGIVRALLIALLTGGIAFVVTKQIAAPAPNGDELAWLINEFDLNEQQAAQIKALHEAFRPICERHCDAIEAGQAAVAAAANETERAAAADRLIELKAVCQDATRQHLHEVAAIMDPAQRQRYLELIGSRLSEHHHEAPFGLQ